MASRSCYLCRRIRPLTPLADAARNLRVIGSAQLRQFTCTRRPPKSSSQRQINRFKSLATHAPSTASPSLKYTGQGPLGLYDHQVSSNILRNDPHQRKIVALLQKLYDQLENYTFPPIVVEQEDVKPDGFFGGLFGRTKRKEAKPTIDSDTPKGLYLFGDVGCGKTMLMDLFYAALPKSIPSRRVHFHAFMIDVHKRLHAMTQAGVPHADALVPVARTFAEEARVLCFDEFQVTDITDAMILRRLMESMIGYGVVIVATSNRAPDELYKNGIQRQSFVPCIELIKQRFTVKDLDSGTDYRKLPRALSKVYFDPINEEHTREFEKLFNALTDDEFIVEDRKLSVWGRPLRVPKSTSKVAEFTFDELCGQSLSAADYLEITKNFETVFVRDIPRLRFDQRDRARRFILFIDAAYESKTRLFTLSEVHITKIFSDKPSEQGEITAHQRSIMDDLGLSAETVGTSSIFTGEEEVFAFARAVSRLSEMGSLQWASGSKATGPELDVTME